MRKLNHIRRAIIFACTTLVFGFGAAGFSAGCQAGQSRWDAGNCHHDAVFEGATKPPQTLTNAGVVYDSGFNVQQPESSPGKLEGDWEGILDAGSAKLKLVLRVIGKGGGLTAMLDSPDQGATGLTIDSITLSGASVRFEMKSFDAIYQGQLAKEGSEIEGKWTQAGQAFPLNLKRVGSSAGASVAVESPLKSHKVDVGGHSLSLLIGGKRDEAMPAVILEAGFGTGIISWSMVQLEIAKFSQVVSYDRAGLGQSDPGPKPRDAKQIATELHLALQKAGIKPPYVLVGHSLGGPYVRVFAAMYPKEVVGMVLIDPSQEAFDAWIRRNPPPVFKEREAQIAKAPQGMRDEWEGVKSTYEQARAAKLPARIPVTLLTAMKDDGMPVEARLMWAEKHKEWMEKVPGGKHIVAEKSGHAIQAQEPALVVEAIREVIAQASGGVRKTAAP